DLLPPSPPAEKATARQAAAFTGYQVYAVFPHLVAPRVCPSQIRGKPRWHEIPNIGKKQWTAHGCPSEIRPGPRRLGHDAPPPPCVVARRYSVRRLIEK